MIHTTGQVGRPSLCHRHILDNWELALGSWETGMERKQIVVRCANKVTL